MQNEYKLKSNQQNEMMKRLTKLFSIFLVCIILMSALSGCASVGCGSSASENPLWWHTSDGFKTKFPDNSEHPMDDKIIGVRLEDSDLRTDAVWNSFRSSPSLREKANTGVLREVAIMMHNSIFTEGLAYDASNDPLVNADDISVLSLEPSSLIVKVSEITSQHLDPNDPSNSTLADIISVMQGFAAAILISMWAMGFISQIVNEKFTMETLLKTLMQLLCGILVITNATVLVTAFVDSGIALVNAVGDIEYTAFENLSADIHDSLSKVSIFDARSSFLGKHNDLLGTYIIDFKGPVYAILLMILPFIAELLCAYKICSIMIMRMLELVMRITFAPIPLAFSAQSGFSQEATRYLRSTLACAVQPALMLVGCTFVGVIAEVVLNIFTDDVAAGGPGGPLGSIAMCMSYFILNAFIGESKHLAQEIIAR